VCVYIYIYIYKIMQEDIKINLSKTHGMKMQNGFIWLQIVKVAGSC